MTHPNTPEIKRAASANDGRVKRWRDRRNASRSLKTRYDAFLLHFEKVHYDIATGVFLFLISFQYFLARKGYESWADIFLGANASRVQIILMTVVMAIGMAILSGIVAELLSASFSKAIYRWKVKLLADELGSYELAEEQTAITVKSLRGLGISAAIAVILLAGIGLGTRAAINSKASTSGASTAVIDPERFLQVAGIDTTQTAETIIIPGATAADLTKGMSIWSVFFFLVALIAEFGAGIYLWIYLRFLISVARPLRRSERERELLLQEILISDQRIDNLLREAFLTDDLELVASSLGNVVAATAERVRFRFPNDPDKYLADSIRFIDVSKQGNMTNGQSHDPAKEVHQKVETGNEV